MATAKKRQSAGMQRENSTSQKQRLAEELRANLLKRKALSRGRMSQETNDDTATTPERGEGGTDSEN